MQVEAVPTKEFVDGRINAHEGHPIMLDEFKARDLERRGLVRIRLAPAPKTASADKDTAGKASGDGKGQPSPSLHQAPVSPMQTLRLSKHGGGKRRKIGA